MNICGVDLSFSFTGFHLIYVLIACFMWICSLLFSVEYMKHYENKKRYYIFMLATWAATALVLASADLLTCFIFFEIMSFTSYVLVIHEETPGPMRAGETYLAVAVIGGMVMLMGLFLLYDAVGTLSVNELAEAARLAIESGRASYQRIFAAGLCILIGFGAKAGMVPLHIWLPKAHPVAPAPASALLSGVLTKAGIFGIIIISVNLFFEDAVWGIMLASIGMLTMSLGAVLGVFSVDLKRTLACSSVSQIGFIISGIAMICLLGDENALAARGTILHMVNHSMVKLLLFSAAGVIYMNTHKLDLNDIRGYGRKKPLLMLLFLAGAASISGIPGTSGYISKTLLHEAIVEYIEHAEHLGLHFAAALFSVYEWVFLVTGGLTLCYITKIFVCIFVERNKNTVLQESCDKAASYMTPLSIFCLAAPAAVLVAMGATPHMSMDRLAAAAFPFLHGFDAEYSVRYFSLVNIKGSIISVAIGALLYLLLVRRVFIKEGVYRNLWHERLDLEELVYRPLIKLLLKPGIFDILDQLPDALFAVLMRFSALISAQVDKLPDVVTGFVGVKLFRKWGKGARRVSISAWYHEAESGQAFKALHEAYIDVRDSMSFGLLLASAGLAIFLIYMIVSQWGL